MTPEGRFVGRRLETTMTAKLPPLLADFFAATNAHDVDSMSSAFSEEAVVHDEGGDHRGVLAIRAWMTKTLEAYDYEVEPLELRLTGSEAVVRVLLRGRFPGSPITVAHHFTLSGGTIARLEIRP